MAKSPDFVIWLVTPRCNMRCAYCYVGHFENELSNSEALLVAESLVELRPSSVGITGGEPLLWRPLHNVIEILSAGGVASSVQSNLVLFSPDDAKFFAEREVFLFTSLDGPTKEPHEVFRGAGSWDAVIRGLRLARDAGVEFATVTTVNRANVKELPAILELSRDLGATYAAFLPIIPVGRASGGNFLPNARDLLDAFTALRDAADSLGFKASVWCAPFSLLIGSTKYFKASNCPTRKAFDVLPDGSIPVCDTLRIRVSDIRKGAREAWREYLAHPIVSKLNMEAPIECVDCPKKSKCVGGCRARAYALTGSLEKPDPLCPRIAAVS